MPVRYVYARTGRKHRKFEGIKPVSKEIVVVDSLDSTHTLVTHNQTLREHIIRRYGEVPGPEDAGADVRHDALKKAITHTQLLRWIDRRRAREVYRSHKGGCPALDAPPPAAEHPAGNGKQD